MKNIRKQSVKIHGFMVQQLNLNGSELILYAMVYGFCEEGVEMILDIEELSIWLSLSESLTNGIIWQLTERGLIVATNREIDGKDLITLDIL